MEKSNVHNRSRRRTFVLSVPADELAVIAEGERVDLEVNGITVRVRKQSGRLVREGAAPEVGQRPFSSARSPSRSPRQVLLDRLARLVGRFPDEAIDEALSQDDVGTFTTLSSPEAWSGGATSPTDEARLRGARARNALLMSAGGSLSVETVATMLGVSNEAVRKRLRTRTLIGVKGARGYLVPAIQFEEGRELAGLRQVLKVMPVESPWMRLNWLLSPEPRLDHDKPVDVLRGGGRVEEVIQAAELYGDQGAV